MARERLGPVLCPPENGSCRRRVRCTRVKQASHERHRHRPVGESGGARVRSEKSRLLGALLLCLLGGLGRRHFFGSRCLGLLLSLLLGFLLSLLLRRRGYSR